MMSIATAIYYSWTDTANFQIRVHTVARRIPFPDFLYTITPSLRRYTVLTPYKIGIAYCWILFGALERPVWPGYINAEISEPNVGWTGTLEVINSPQNTVTAPLQQQVQALERILFANETYSSVAQSSPRSNTLAVSRQFERRWFTCLFRTLLYIIKNAFPSSVLEVLPPPASGDSTYHFNCDAGSGNKDQTNISIYANARRDRYQLTWNSLAKTLLLYGTRVAEDEAGWDTTQLVISYTGVTLAGINIRVDRNTATA